LETDVSVDWSRFRDGDRVRVTFEGVWRSAFEGDWRSDRANGGQMWFGPNAGYVATYGTLQDATSAELIERSFTPPEAGKLFRRYGTLFVSVDKDRYRKIRDSDGRPVVNPEWQFWENLTAEDRDAIEVIDSV